jgi:hypothetical protein
VAFKVLIARYVKIATYYNKVSDKNKPKKDAKIDISETYFSDPNVGCTCRNQ